MSSSDNTQGETAIQTGGVQNAARAVAWGGLLAMLVTVFGLAANIITVRLLTDVEFGRYTVVATYSRYASVVVLFTMEAALMRFVPEYQARGDRRGLIHLIYMALSIHTLLWLVFLIGVALISGWLSEINKADLRLLLLCGIGVVLPSVISASFQSILNSYLVVKAQCLTVLIGGALQIALLYLLIRAIGLGGSGALLAQLGMSGTMTIVFGLMIPRLLPSEQSGPFLPMPLMRLVAFSSPYAFNGVLENIFNRQSEVLFLQPFHGEVITGTYSKAYMLSQQFLAFVPGMLYNICTVLASNAYLKGRDSLARFISVYWRLLLMISTAVSVGGFVLADKLAFAFFSSKSKGVSDISSILFLVQATIIWVNPFIFAMRAEEKTWLYFILTPVSAAASLGFSYLLIPKLAIRGALLSTTFSYLAVAAFQYVVFSRNFRYLKLPWGYLTRCYAACVPMLALFFVKGYFGGYWGILVMMPACALLWVVGARMSGLVGREEADLIGQAKLPGGGLLLKMLARY